MKLAERDLGYAQCALKDADFDWACFAAHQAADKALCQSLGADARGHSIVGLLQQLSPSLCPQGDLTDLARGLDRHCIPARYPNAFPAGAPFEHDTAAQAEEATTKCRMGPGILCASLRLTVRQRSLGCTGRWGACAPAFGDRGSDPVWGARPR